MLLKSVESHRKVLINQYLLSQVLADHKVPSPEEIETHRLERIKRNMKMNVSRYKETVNANK